MPALIKSEPGRPVKVSMRLLPSLQGIGPTTPRDSNFPGTDYPGGPSSPFLPFFLAGSTSRGRDCDGVPAGAGFVSFGVSTFGLDAPGSVRGGGTELSSRRGVTIGAVFTSGFAGSSV